MNRYDLVVGHAVHKVIGSVALLGREAGATRLREVAWTTAGDLLADPSKKLGLRKRAAQLVVASTAAVYARIFLPPCDWTLLGTEVAIDGGRIDLVWRVDDGRVVYDELKLGGSLDLPRGPGRTSRQVHAYADHGLAAHGAAFAGVRLCLLGAPRQSLLIGPGAAVRRLIDTELWFADIEEAAA